jgi:hypothetical protein
MTTNPGQSAGVLDFADVLFDGFASSLTATSSSSTNSLIVFSVALSVMTAPQFALRDSRKAKTARIES